MVTHNMHQALELGNRTIMMDAGRIVFDVKGEERANMTVEDLLQKFRQGAGKSFFYSFFGILRNFSACLTTAVLLVLMTSAAVFLTVGAGLAAGLGGATTYITPIIAILVTTIAQACVWPMYRDLFGPKNLFERLD